MQTSWEKKRKIRVLHREKQVAGSPGERCLHSWSHSVGSGIIKQLSLKSAGDQTQQWKGNWPLHRQVRKHSTVIVSDLSLRIPKLRALKGEDLDSQKMTGLNQLNSGSTIHSRMKGRQQVVSHCHVDCSRIRTTTPIITHGSQHIPCFSESSPDHLCFEQS